MFLFFLWLLSRRFKTPKMSAELRPFSHHLHAEATASGRDLRPYDRIAAATPKNGQRKHRQPPRLPAIACLFRLVVKRNSVSLSAPVGEISLYEITAKKSVHSACHLQSIAVGIG
jgi:hypothetical protein